MNKKVTYTPVIGIVEKQPKKHLAQGSLQRSPQLHYRNISHCISSPQQKQCKETEEIQTFKPPTIICHSPAVIHSNINNCGHYSGVDKIVVDAPSSLRITSQHKHEESLYNSNDVVSQNSDHESKEGLSTSRPVYCKDNNVHADCSMIGKFTPASSFLADHFVGQHATDHIDEKGNESALLKCKQKTKRKTKAAKVIESRYLTSAPSRKPTLKSNCASSSSQIDVSKIKSSALHGHDSIPKPNISLAMKSKDEKAPNEKGKTSTPSAGFKSIFEADISTIAANASQVQHKPKPSIPSINQDEITQRDLNIAYSRYLRMAYLRNRLLKAGETRQKNALLEITRLCDTNVKLQEEISELEDEVKFLEYQEQIHKELDVQLAALGPVVNKISTIEEKYTEMVSNVDTTRHGLEIENVIVPSTEHLDSSLQQTQNILGDVSTLIHSHTQSAWEAAGHGKHLANIIIDEKAELKSSEELSEQLTLLSTKEANLSLQLETETMLVS